MSGYSKAQCPQLSQEWRTWRTLSFKWVVLNLFLKKCRETSAKPLTWGYDYSQQATLMNVWNRTESLLCEDFPVYSSVQSLSLELDISARGLQDQIFRGNSIRLFCNLFRSPSSSTCLCININWSWKVCGLVFLYVFLNFIGNFLLFSYSHSLAYWNPKSTRTLNPWTRTKSRKS